MSIQILHPERTFLYVVDTTPVEFYNAPAAELLQYWNIPAGMTVRVERSIGGPAYDGSSGAWEPTGEVFTGPYKPSANTPFIPGAEFKRLVVVPAEAKQQKEKL